MRIDENIGVNQYHLWASSLVGFALRYGEGFADVVDTCYSQLAKRDRSRPQTLTSFGSIAHILQTPT